MTEIKKHRKTSLNSLLSMLITKILITSSVLLFQVNFVSGQTGTYTNPVIPGDHPDPTLTKIGNDFYTSGSSFNPTPKIYHSTDLVHWEVIAQPVAANWATYGNRPGGGVWGGHMVYHNDKYWHYFGKGGGNMYFVKADSPEGPWSAPVRVNPPPGIWGLGVDNSIFIDDNNKWYLLTKAGQENNHILELGNNGQPNGKILDLTWLNPNSEGNPYGWAEGPVMWKHNGYYYYSFAQHLVGSQYVMRSDTLSDNKEDWTIIGTNIFKGTTGEFYAPNHISPAVKLNDSTSWVIAHSYHDKYYAQGRQGLLCEVTYSSDGFPEIIRPSINPKKAPKLPSGGIPWMVPHTDLFDSEKLNPEWSFLGYTPSSTWSLTERPGWLKLSPISSTGKNTVIKNDGEHNFSLITKVDFTPESESDEAGLWIINGPESHKVKVASTMNSSGINMLSFSFEDKEYKVVNSIGPVVWLKLVRNEHRMYGYYSSDGANWNQIGQYIYAIEIDNSQTDFNDFTGNQQGLFTKGKTAWFDIYIYRDAYTPISAANPANQNKTESMRSNIPPNILGSINNNDWAMYAGVEFGNIDYPKQADSVSVSASCMTSGGKIEFYLDSLAGIKIAEIEIGETGGWSKYQNFTAPLNLDISGSHDVYLKFITPFSWELFRLKTISFIDNDFSSSANIFKMDNNSEVELEMNYPNPFKSETSISYDVSKNSHISLTIYDLNGKLIETLFEGFCPPGKYISTFNAEGKQDGAYLCNLKVAETGETKNIIIVKQN